MDIAFVNRMAGITRGGGEMWDLKMAEGLEERGAEVTFYVGRPLCSELPEPIDGFETVEVPTPHLRDWAYAAPPGVGGALSDADSTVFCRRVARKLRRRNHDLVQICSRPRFAKYVDELDAKTSVVMHGQPYSLWHDVIKPQGSTYGLLGQFDQVIAVGGADTDIREKVTTPVETVNPGVETDVFTPATDPDETDRILFVGRFVPAKNLELLVEAFNGLLDQNPEAELVLVGEGPERGAIETAIEQRGLSERVRLPGYVPNNELPDLYRRASVFVLSSSIERHPITLLEAMSCGVPVVAPTVGAIPEIVDDGQNGVTYRANSQTQLRSKLTNLLFDASRRRELGENARLKAVEEFDWEKRRDRLFKIYKNMATN